MCGFGFRVRFGENRDFQGNMLRFRLGSRVRVVGLYGTFGIFRENSELFAGGSREWVLFWENIAEACSVKVEESAVQRVPLPLATESAKTRIRIRIHKRLRECRTGQLALLFTILLSFFFFIRF